MVPVGWRVLIVVLALLLPLAAAPLDEAWQALEAGDWEQARRRFGQIEGPEGRLGLARVDLLLGRPERALIHLQGNSVPESVLRMEALYEAGLYTRAFKLLRKLEQQEHSAFPSPFDFHFYITRGNLEREAGHFGLALKNFDEAEKRSKTADQKALAIARRTWVWLDQGEVQKANDRYSQLEALIPQIKSIWTTTQVLDVGFGVNRLKGERTNAHALKRAERDLYRARGNDVRAASALVNIRNLESFRSDSDQNLQLTVQALKEFLEAEDWSGATDRLNDLRYMADEVGPRVSELEGHLEAALKLYPEGEWKDRARLSRAEFLLEIEAPPPKVREAFTGLTSSDYAAVRAHAYRGLASQARQLGDYTSATAALSRSLALSSPQSRYDRDWNQSPGYTLLEMSRLENERHHYRQALELARRAVSSQGDSDWTWWRVRARRESLSAALGLHDQQAAVAEFRASLEDIKALPQISFRAGALTSITGALLLNRVVGDDVLEPTVLLFEEYDELVQGLIQEVYSDPRELAYLLDTFDGWKEEAFRRKQTQMLGYPSIQKGIVLETLGRRAQARESFRNGIETAGENGVQGAQMAGHVLLARLAGQEGRLHEAADHATQASTVAKGVDKRLARLYAVIAGGAQREAGRYSTALKSFDFAIAQNPEKAWAGLFGRALTRERMNQPREALSDVDAALTLLEESDFASTRVKVLATKARLLSLLERDEQALKIFSQAFARHRMLGVDRHLPQLALDYSHTLQKLSRHQEALQILTTAVDQLVDWQTPSFKNSQRLFERVVAVALELGDNETALRYLQMSHSAAVLDSVDLADVDAEPRTQALLQEVKRLKLRLSRLRERNAEENDSLGQLLATTREDFFVKLAELRTQDPDFEALVSVTGSQLTSLQELLPEKSVLLEYFPSKSKLYIFAVGRHNFRLHQVALSRDELESLSREHMARLQFPGQNSQEYTETAQHLRRLLLDPVRLEQYDALRVVPSGPVWRVPLGTLLDEEGRPLHQRFEISYLASSDILPIYKNHSAASRLPESSLLVGGAPELAGVAREVEVLKRLLPGAETLTESELSLETFRDRSERADLVHIASHSAVQRDTEDTYIQMGVEQLGLGQIYGLNLRAGAMVVLSSCRTAVGTADAPGKEVNSLSSAFSVAGASTVIASRWKVDDGSTIEFFEHFYQALLRGKSRGQALREAQLEMAKLKPHPYYWAGFSLFGDPGE